MNAIQKVFWIKGLSATSLDDLVAATGVNRPSLYATYGDKTAMYLAALAAFAERMGEQARGAMARETSLEAGLLSFYKAMLDIYFGQKEEALGCFVMTTAATAAISSPDVRTMLDDIITRIDGMLCAYIEEQTKADHLDPSQVSMRAEMATGMLINLSLRARAGQPREKLNRMAKAAAKLIASAT